MRYKTLFGNGRTVHIAICEICREPLKHVGSAAQKYCPECKKFVDREKSKERMRKHRAKKKAN